MVGLDKVEGDPTHQQENNGWSSRLLELPAHLRERTRVVRDSKSLTELSADQFVLYWMQTAMRAEENPALDVASALAHRLNLPLLVYQGISPRYAYASDRHHTFILEGAVDLQRQFAERGIAYACTLEQSAQELKGLLQRAAVVIAEDMPTDPSRLFHRAALRASDCSWLAVDTACIVPMQLVGRSYERAFEFRDATRKMFAERARRAWPPTAFTASPFDISLLKFEPLDFTRERIADLVARCPIDHLIPAVLDTRGGSLAGYARWDAFRNQKLQSYANDRNDALKPGSSRMSAYLHYGMVSPMRIAREAADVGGAGAEKFLDELFIWRELAYGFCFYRPDHDRYSALPDWARDTLEEHRRDRRTQQYTWEELSRGATLDAFWNAAQRSLLVHGELHNNVRMTWGKALVGWCAEPRTALKRLIDLNHRYALDGRDPASFGGLLWCLGQFDRPHNPEQPIYGSVRTRPTWEHARRLDVKAYAQHTSRPRGERPLRIAVIGVGLSGSIAARTLEDQGSQVELFDKSERPSGRMSTRRTTEAEFDHGAQYFTCRDQTFQRYVDSWVESGAVGLWKSPIAVFRDGRLQSFSNEKRYVCLPHMNELGKRLTRLMNVKYGVRIQSIARGEAGWHLVDEHQRRYGPYDRVITSLPAPQSAALLVDEPALAAQLNDQKYHACWAVMATLAEPLCVAAASDVSEAAHIGGAFINSGPIGWMARNGTKPGRNATVEALVLHATPEWSESHLQSEPSQVAEELMNAFWPAIGSSQPVAATSVAAHRWLYARPALQQPLPYRCLFNSDRTLIACGDWASGGRVEGAFLSGAAAVGVALAATT